jgi:hypothetical protein
MPRTRHLFFALPLTAVALVALAGSARAQDAATPPKFSIALERVGGINYTKAFAKDTDDAASLTAFGVGGPSVSPYSSPRLGLDYIVDGGLTIGAGLSFARYSLSATSANGNTTTTQNLGSLFLYTLSPRVGYRIPVSPDFDIIPRGGVTLAGGSVSNGDNQGSEGVFALALSGEGVAAYRVTRSFNLLGGVGVDYTLTASASASDSNGSTTTSSDLKGGLFAVQLWLGIGGYL